MLKENITKETEALSTILESQIERANTLFDALINANIISNQITSKYEKTRECDDLTD